MLIDDNRCIVAVNDPFRLMFALDRRSDVTGEPFGELARRLTMHGHDGLLALGDNLVPHDDGVPTTTDIVMASGLACEARAARLDDRTTLVTISRPEGNRDARSGAIAADIIDHLPGAVVRLLVRPDGWVPCIFASAMSPGLFGRTIAELTDPALDFRTLIDPRDVPAFSEELGPPPDRSSTVDFEVRILNAAAGTPWVRCIGSKLLSGDGAVMCDVRMFDIEKRVAISEEKSHLQTLLDTVLDNIPLMISVRDVEQNVVVYVNRMFEMLSGRSREEIIGQTTDSLFEGETARDRRALTRKVIDDGETAEFPEKEVDTARMGRRILKSTKYPLLDDEGHVRYILSITDDVTGRRRAEEAIRRNEDRLHDAIENFTDAIALYDADDRLVLCNSRYHRMWPRGDFDVKPGQRYEEIVRAHMVEAVRNGADIDVEATVRRLVHNHRNPPATRETELFNGRWLHVTDRKTSEGGVVVTGTDITSLKEREDRLREISQEALRAKEAAEIANRSKSHFLANMSHELRTPLNAIIGFSEIIRDALLGPAAIGQYQNYAEDIHASGTHLLELINDILDMSKIEAGKLELAEGPVNLCEAIEQSIRLVGERAEEHAIELRTDIDPGLPAMRGDVRKIKQIFINLLSNAVKFTPERGCVTVAAHRAGNGDFIITVTDTGIGIAEDDLPRVIQPFGQAETGLDRQYEGTGLGLTLTKALSELHGGGFALDSRTDGPDRGTTATVRFPASRAL